MVINIVDFDDVKRIMNDLRGKIALAVSVAPTHGNFFAASAAR